AKGKPGGTLLANTETAENFPEHFIVIDAPEDVADRSQCAAEFLCDKLRGDVGEQSLARGVGKPLRPFQRRLVTRVDRDRPIAVRCCSAKDTRLDYGRERLKSLILQTGNAHAL